MWPPKRKALRPFSLLLLTSSAHQVLHRSFSYCTALLRASVRKFCHPVTFAEFFCDPFVPRRSKKECLRSVRLPSVLPDRKVSIADLRRSKTGDRTDRFVRVHPEIPCRYSRNTPVRKTPVIISEIFGNDCFCGKLSVLVDCFGKPPGGRGRS